LALAANGVVLIFVAIFLYVVSRITYIRHSLQELALATNCSVLNYEFGFKTEFNLAFCSFFYSFLKQGPKRTNQEKVAPAITLFPQLNYQLYRKCYEATSM